MAKRKDGDYDKVIGALFKAKWKRGKTSVPFTKDHLIETAERLGIRIKNLPDVLYAYRSRRPMPAEIARTGGWTIVSTGSGLYAFELDLPEIEIPEHLEEIPIPYAVPEIVEKNLAKDEQGLLTKVRYNRLLDIFTGIACFHLQSHIRTQVEGIGQIEIDDLYVGVDKEGIGYVLPVEAKVSMNRLAVAQVRNLVSFANERFPHLTCKPIAIIDRNDTITCFEFVPSKDIRSMKVRLERRYRLVREEGEA